LLSALLPFAALPSPLLPVLFPFPLPCKSDLNVIVVAI
jgi:hypothetical protein